MGFKRRIYTLAFADPSWEGLEVKARGATLKEAVELDRLIGLGSQIGDDEHEDDRALFLSLLDKLIVSWNLVEDDDTPIPCDVEHLEQQEYGLLLRITRAWFRATVQVPPPLPRPSNSGGLSPEESEAMAALSESLTS